MGDSWPPRASLPKLMGVRPGLLRSAAGSPTVLKHKALDVGDLPASSPGHSTHGWLHGPRGAGTPGDEELPMLLPSGSSTRALPASGAGLGKEDWVDAGPMATPARPGPCSSPTPCTPHVWGVDLAGRLLVWLVFFFSFVICVCVLCLPFVVRAGTVEGLTATETQRRACRRLWGLRAPHSRPSAARRPSPAGRSSGAPACAYCTCEAQGTDTWETPGSQTHTPPWGGGGGECMRGPAGVSSGCRGVWVGKQCECW